MSKIDDLKAKLAELEAGSHITALMPKSSGWLSRKLLVVLAVIGVLIFLGRENVNLILGGIVTLGIVYLITQAAHDIVSSITDAWVRRKLIEAMAKDGLDDAEKAALGLPVAPTATNP
jgi:divalent metal cation (Fe/Co/Zn/Cd) transporter